MAYERTNAPAVVVHDVWVRKNNGSDLAASITAPTFEGYEFVCWTGVATDGDVGTPYIASYSSASTTVWDRTRRGTNIVATALYRLS